MREKIFKKGIKKRLFSVVLALAMVVALLPMNSMKAYAADTSGDFGEGDCLHWELVGDTLTISGNGEMPDFVNPPTGVPWSGVGASIVNVVIESGVKSVGRYAFNLHSTFPNIASVTLPEGLEKIGRLAFRGCSNLTSISLPSSLKTIDEGAFLECGLTSIEIPKNISYLANGTSGNGIFEGCFDLTTVTFAEGFSYTNIPDYMFDGCGSLTNIAIPASVTSIGGGVFSRCGSLTDITIPENVTSIGVGAFDSCGNLTNITISENVASIEGMTFSNCRSLTNITIPASVTSIGDGAFSECSSLTNITIPASVTSIGDGVFSECRNLTFIKVDAIAPPTVEIPEIWSLFYMEPRGFSKIYVPQASVAAYKAAAGWSQYEDKIEGFHDFTYSVTTTNTENDTIKATCGKPEICDLTTADKSVSLTLTASNPNYSGISGLDAFNTATGRTGENAISGSDVKFYTVTTEGATTGGTGETSTPPTADGYYYASLTVGGVTAVKAFTIGTPGGSTPNPDPTPIIPTPTPVPAPAPAPVVVPEMKTENIAGATLNTWEEITVNTPKLTVEDLHKVNASNDDLLHVNIVGKEDKTVPVAAVQAIAKSSIDGLHVFIGESDAITFLSDKDYTNYTGISFKHEDVVTDDSRTIDFTSKGAINATVLFHTLIAPNTKAKVYIVLENEEKEIATLTSNEDGGFCFEITELAKYIIRY